MTTEVASASEVKKGSDPSGADAHKEKAKEVVENEQTAASELDEGKPPSQALQLKAKAVPTGGSEGRIHLRTGASLASYPHGLRSRSLTAL